MDKMKAKTKYIIGGIFIIIGVSLAPLNRYIFQLDLLFCFSGGFTIAGALNNKRLERLNRDKRYY